MIRTQVSLTEDQMVRVRRLADRLGVSVAELVRRGLDRLLEEDVEERRRVIAGEAVGGFHSGDPSLVEEHDEALAETSW